MDVVVQQPVQLQLLLQPTAAADRGAGGGRGAGAGGGAAAAARAFTDWRCVRYTCGDQVRWGRDGEVVSVPLGRPSPTDKRMGSRPAQCTLRGRVHTYDEWLVVMRHLGGSHVYGVLRWRRWLVVPKLPAMRRAPTCHSCHLAHAMLTGTTVVR